MLTLLLTGILCLLIGALLAYWWVSGRYVSPEQHARVQQEADLHYENLQERTAEVLRLSQDKARLEAEAALRESVVEQSAATFQRTADKLFEEKARKFSAQNAEQIGHLLTPLRERIQGFEQQVERRFLAETKDRVSLQQEIKRLQQLNVQISTEANNLAGALRGNTKTQGDWGEWQLLTLLEASGLQQGIHFRSQSSFRDENGRQKRPDFIIDLPDDKQLVIDSKVSLTAYERYCACDDQDTNGRREHARAHLTSLRRHVTDLAGKNYTRLYQINSPDYLLLFVPIEPAYGLALSTDSQVFLDALERNIVIVTPSTLLATLRTVNFIWKQEKQKQNVLEIARQSGQMYDKFVSFTEDLKKVGHRLDQAQASWDGAMRKLSTGEKYGATLVGRAERIRKLGVKNKKVLDGGLLGEEE